ncbi:MAG TPA: two-component regulator propeller domain-containing protein [Ignavibacteriales bacterium]|nr:two-component regulator propeller domain-containing protein [Ignavibacteriales bacterium]
MKSRMILAVVTLLLSSLAVYAQQIGVWRNYSNMQNVRSAQASSDGIWAATAGGAFFYSFSDSSYQKLEKAEGLSSNSLTSLAVDRNGKVWLGGEGGSIDVYDPVKKVFDKKILDISSLDKGQKKINSFSLTGDSVYAATDFGISLLSSGDFTFKDTYLKLGSFPSDTKVNSVYYKDLLYAATENGIAAQKPGTTNLSAPESWNNFTTAQGLPANSVSRIAGFKDTIITATALGLAYLNGNYWYNYLPQFFGGLTVVDILVKADSLYIATPESISLYYNGKVSQLAQAPPNAQFTGIISANSHGIFTSTTKGLIVPAPNPNPAFYYPEGPSSNLFNGMSVDKDGNLWSGSGSGEGATGFYVYNGQKWTNYDAANVPAPNNLNQFFKTYISPDNTPYVMSWGEGFLRFQNGHFQLFNSSNSPMGGVPENPAFVVVHGLSTDSRGNLWALTYKSANKTPLYELKADSTWQSFTSTKFFSKVMLGFELLVDQYDTKWMIISETGQSTGNAVYYFNQENPLNPDGDYDENGLGVISSSNSPLNSSSINALALDRRGELWIGTSAGINVIPDTQNPRNNIGTVEPLRSRVVNCITVDALNQKWVGTQQGVFVVSSDGTKLISNYTSSNSPLPSDVVNSIAIDNNTGTVYMGTDYGLTSVTTTAVKPQESFTGMFVYPNPVVIQNGSPVNITIEGLVRDSDIKILSISGKVLNTFTSPGAGVAVWNGKDMDGNYVASGVYIIVAYDRDGTNVASAKVAILRKN